MQLWRTFPETPAPLPVAMLLDRDDASIRAPLAAGRHHDPLVEAIRHPARQAEVRDRRTALRLLAASLTGDPVNQLVITHDDVGRPTLPGAGLHLSLSSRGRWIALAAGTMPLGIDVETAITDEAIPFAALHPDEAASLRGTPEAERHQAAARLWAAKEAYWKARAFPTSIDPAAFAVTLHGNTFDIADTRHGPASGRFLTDSKSLPAVAFVML